MKTLLIDNAERQSDFNKPLAEVLRQFTDFEAVNYHDATAGDAGNYGAIILSGVPIHYSFGSIDDRRRRLAWIQDISNPVLGICLGHQVLGSMFGAEVNVDEPEQGLIEVVAALPRDPILNGMSVFPAEALHRGSISLPDGFIQIASSVGCRNQIMRHGERPIYGMQFHPERLVTTHILISNFIELAGS